MEFLVATRFECEGEFVEFIRNSEGKRRMILRLPSGETEFKLPKDLPPAFRAAPAPGAGSRRPRHGGA